LNKKVKVKTPSFPQFKYSKPLPFKENKTWQVLCGDTKHWRSGIYSPSFSKKEEVTELEMHTCPELFILIEGKVILVLEEKGKIKELNLEYGKPVMINTWHNAYCPDGVHTGKVFVVERDEFITEYKDTKFI
jgi:hypothetical protein